MKKDYLGKSLLIITLATIGATVLYAWTGPGNNSPRSGNPSGPLDIGPTDQIKDGDICTMKGGVKKCLSNTL